MTELAREGRWLTTIALGSAAAISYTDYRIPDVSLGVLYLIPITLISMTGRSRLAFPLTLACLVLRARLGPFPMSGRHWLIGSLLAGTGYFFVSWLIVRRSRERLQLHARDRARQEQLTEDLALAAATQRMLLPHTAPTLDGFEIAGKMFPSRIVGGDYYGFFTRGTDRIGVAVGDVSGKGVAAGMLIPVLGTSLRMGLDADLDLPNLISKTDDVLYAETKLARYATLVYGEIEATGRKLIYCNAGHPPPLLYRGPNAPEYWLETGGTPIGLLPHRSFATETLDLREGDVLVLHTDGLTDAENESGVPWGRERLVQCVARNAHLSADSLLRAVKSELDTYTQPLPLADDCTVVVVKVVPSGSNTADDSE